MLVDCPDCGRSYRIVAADLGARGRVVICPRCNARWFQRAEGAAGIEAGAWSVVRTAERAPRPDREADGALTAGRSALPQRLLRRARIAAAAVSVAAVVAAGIGAREPIVRAAPRTAAIFAALHLPVNLRGLRFARLTPTRAAADVALAGEIRNVARGRVRLPRLVFEVRDETGAALMRWSESPPAATLAAGRAVTFASSPRRLPVAGRTVVVRFADRAADEPAPSATGEPMLLRRVALR